MKRSFIIIIFLAFPLIIGAQQPITGDCSSNLRLALAEYQTGFFNDCIKMLEGMLDSCDFSRKQKEMALQMLAKAYIETGETEKAESMVYLLLKNFPHYELKEEDNPELYNRMVKKYQVHPLFTIGAKNTANWLRRRTTKVYSVLDGLDYSMPLDESGYWFTYYGMAEYEFKYGISINADFMTWWSSYSRNFTKEPSFNLSYWEKDNFIELPVYLKKYFSISRSVIAYASGGMSLLYIYRARGNVALSYTKDDVITGKNSDFSGGWYDINTMAIKNQTTGEWNAGVGIGYKLKNLRMFLDARYLGGLGSFTAPEKSDNIPQLKNDFFYIDQSMKLKQFEVGATISYTLINSVKRIHK
jgi:hypothetical protein